MKKKVKEKKEEVKEEVKDEVKEEEVVEEKEDHRLVENYRFNNINQFVSDFNQTLEESTSKYKVYIITHIKGKKEEENGNSHANVKHASTKGEKKAFCK